MKTKFLLSVLLSFYFCLLPSQVPQGFNYQAIARDGTGAVLPNQGLTVRISIQPALASGNEFWIETHSIITDKFGVMVLVIGNGSKTGGSAGVFSDIPWGSQTLYLKTEIENPPSIPDFTVMGTTQLWSVPYSLVAGNLKGSLSQLEVDGTTTTKDPALFAVRNAAGDTVFAVYNEAVRVYVDNGSKGAKGGFAIGGFGTGKSVSQKYFYVKSDTVRVYIDDTDKGAKGGFAIGGFGTSKGKYDSYLKVQTDTVAAGKVNYLNLTPLNVFIGEQAGLKTVPSGGLNGIYNSFIGYQAGLNNVSGYQNCFMGYQAGSGNISGFTNVFIGNRAGYSNIGGYDNVFLGDASGYSNQSGTGNTFIGYGSGLNNISGGTNTFIGSDAGANNDADFNTFLGYSSGYYNTSGVENIFLGYYAGYYNKIGVGNTMIGSQAGEGQESVYPNNNPNYNVFLGDMSGRFNYGNNNVFIGYGSGYNCQGLGNVLIGYQAGQQYAGDNKLFIENSTNISTPLIYGDFSAKQVGIGTASPSYTLEVKGSVAGTSPYANTSDIRLKKDIQPIIGALDKVMALQGITFYWDKTVNPELNVDDRNHIGFAAQDIEKVLPQVVSTATDKMQTKSVAYGDVVPVLVEAIKEQQQQIEATKLENQQLKSELGLLKEKIEQIAAQVEPSGTK